MKIPCKYEEHWTENQSPLGSGQNWSMEFADCGVERITKAICGGSMDLIEELAKKRYESESHYHTWDEIKQYVRDTYKQYVLDEIPIFEKFMKQIENPYHKGIQSENVYRCGLGFEHFRSNAISELKKYSEDK